MPARYVFLDEVDAYPASADDEGDSGKLPPEILRLFRLDFPSLFRIARSLENERDQHTERNDERTCETVDRGDQRCRTERVCPGRQSDKCQEQPLYQEQHPPVLSDEFPEMLSLSFQQHHDGSQYRDHSLTERKE